MKKRKINLRIPKLIIVELVVIALVIVGLGLYWVHRHIEANNAAPVITIEAESNEFSVTATEDDFLKDVVATDKEDGNVTESIIIEHISQIIDGNKRTITYVAFDSSNNVKKLDRDIVYTDYKAPEIKCDKDILVGMGSSAEILSKVSAVDVIDGDISEQVKLEINDVKYGVPGKYAAKLTVTNSSGDVATKNVVVTVAGEEVQ